jgi:L-lactate dehydrogenase complex protein LldG
MSSRDAVLSRIRRSLRVQGSEVDRRAMVIARLEGSPAGIIPARGQLPAEERIALFATMAERVSATVARVADAASVPAAIAAFLREHNLPATARMGADPRLAAMPWAATPLTVSHGPAIGSDAVGVSHAAAGVAETGTLVLLSGPDNPTSVNFLPETHIAVIAAADIVGDYEAAFAMIRVRYGKGLMPRTVNMITGPSRSADIEQTLLLGAHGPKKLHIVIAG